MSATLAIMLMIAGCQEPTEVIEENYQPRYLHDAYTHGLYDSGLSETQLGRLWVEEAEKALSSPQVIKTPFATHIYVSETEAKGFGYQFEALLGQEVTIRLQEEKSQDGEIFMDLFRINDDPEVPLHHVASADTILNEIIFEPKADRTYILRLQPELLRKGKYRLEIQSRAALAFPVSGKDKSAIGSLFGAPRDAGRRKHHGIDIFSRRHTPIIAPCDGYVRGTEPNMLGGKVIWLKDDERTQVLYFAHLQDVLVDEGDYVTEGDTIGTVGNSGNAITTSPHLHFGIYSEGPRDPYNFVVDPRTRFKRELAKKDRIGDFVRTNKSARLRLLDTASRSITLIEDQLLLVRGTTGMYYHVELPDGTSGHISYGDIEELSRPLRKKLPEQSDLLDEPSDVSILIKESSSLKEAEAIALHGDYTFISIGEEYRWVKS